MDFNLEEVIQDIEDQSVKEALVELKKDPEMIEVPKDFFWSGGEENTSENVVKVSSDLSTGIRNLPLIAKVKLALFGNRDARRVLLREATRDIKLLVLKNPGLREDEISELVRNPITEELLLREISRNRNWMKNYSVKTGLVFNPKCPVDLGLQWIKHLRERELRSLSKSKDVSQVITVQALKLVQKRGR